jgi:hypothetical protein
MAHAFGLSYLPNSYRLPFQQHLYRTGEARRQTLLRFVDERYLKKADQFGAIEYRVRLPLFLAAILSRATKRSDVVSLLEETRSQASALRRRKTELEDAIRREDIEACRRLMRALETEDSPKLWQWAAATGAVMALGYIGAAAEGLHPASMHALETAGHLLGGGLAVKFVEERLFQNVISPRFRVLNRANVFASQAMNNADKISSIWGVTIGETFARTAGNLQKLKY